MLSPSQVLRNAGLALLVATSSSALAAPQQDKTVALVVSLDPEMINTPTVELYQAIAAYSHRSATWHLSHLQEVKRNLPTTAALASLGAIPAFDRHAFIAAKNAAKSSGTKSPETRLIGTVQSMLDTLALDGALIVDCTPAGAAAVHGCGLYYYDRSQARIVAAMAKTFPVAIADASRWSENLLVGLSSGMTAASTNKERQRLNEVLAETSEDKVIETTLAELRLGGASVTEPRHHISSLPEASVLLGREAGGFAGGLILGLGQAAANGGSDRVQLSQREAGLFAEAQSHALESLVWTLDLSLSYAVTTVASQSANAAAAGSLRTQAIRIAAGPGLLWQLTKGFQCGVAVDLGRDVPLTTAASGLYNGATMSQSRFALGLRTRWLF